jgi:hypothetical protein
MPRLVTRSGVVVNVSDEKAERVGAVLGVPVESEPEPAPKPARRSSK